MYSCGIKPSPPRQGPAAAGSDARGGAGAQLRPAAIPPARAGGQGGRAEGAGLKRTRRGAGEAARAAVDNRLGHGPGRRDCGGWKCGFYMHHGAGTEALLHL